MNTENSRWGKSPYNSSYDRMSDLSRSHSGCLPHLLKVALGFFMGVVVTSGFFLFYFSKPDDDVIDDFPKESESTEVVAPPRRVEKQEKPEKQGEQEKREAQEKQERQEKQEKQEYSGPYSFVVYGNKGRTVVYEGMRKGAAMKALGMPNEFFHCGSIYIYTWKSNRHRLQVTFEGEKLVEVSQVY